VCTWPFLLPYFLPTILAAGATRHETTANGASAMPVLTAGEVGLYNSYAWALVVVVLAAVLFGYGRRRAAGEGPVTHAAG